MSQNLPTVCIDMISITFFLDAFGTGGSTTQLDFSFIQLNPLPFFPLQRSQILGES